jgi:serine/threonine protein kinase
MVLTVKFVKPKVILTKMKCITSVDLLTGERVAIKRLANIFEDVVDAKRVLREIYILRHLRHDNIIRLLNVLLPQVA